MTSTDDHRFNDRIVSRTEAYTGRLVDCVELVRELLEAYRTGSGYDEIADRIRTLESRCDRTNRQLSALVTNARVEDLGLLNSRVHFSRAQVIELYQLIDDVPNAAERIADDLVTIEPRTSARWFEGLREMVDCAETAVVALEAAVNAFVRLLCAPSESGSVVDEIRTIREAESACDGLRNDVIAAAFEDESVPESLLCREFAYRFDALVDAIEDVADHLVLVSSTEPWITTEPDRERRSPA